MMWRKEGYPTQGKYLLKCLYSMALHEVAIVLAHTPVDLPVQGTRLAYLEIVLLAVKGVKEVILPSRDVPLSLQSNTVFLGIALMPTWLRHSHGNKLL